MEQIIDSVQGFDRAFVVSPGPADDLPVLVCGGRGDAFYYYAPDGQMPKNVNPGDSTVETVTQLLRTAHAAASARHPRRQDTN